MDKRRTCTGKVHCNTCTSLKINSKVWGAAKIFSKIFQTREKHEQLHGSSSSTLHINALSKTQARTPCWAGLKRLMTWLLRHALWGLLGAFLLICAGTHAHTHNHTIACCAAPPRLWQTITITDTVRVCQQPDFDSYNTNTHCWQNPKNIWVYIYWIHTHTHCFSSLLVNTSMPILFLDTPCVYYIAWHYQVALHKCIGDGKWSHRNTSKLMEQNHDGRFNKCLPATHHLNKEMYDPRKHLIIQKQQMNEKTYAHWLP